MSEREVPYENHHPSHWLAMAIGGTLAALQKHPLDKALRSIAQVLLSDLLLEIGQNETFCTSKNLMTHPLLKKMGYSGEIVFKMAICSPKNRSEYFNSNESVDLTELTGPLESILAGYTTEDKKHKRKIENLQREENGLLANIEQLRAENEQLGQAANLNEKIRQLMAGQKQLEMDTLMLPPDIWANLLNRVPADHYNFGYWEEGDELRYQYFTRRQYAEWHVSDLYPEGDVAGLSDQEKVHRLEDMEEAKRQVEESPSNVDSILKCLGKVMHYMLHMG
jgi:hypothetical protein